MQFSTDAQPVAQRSIVMVDDDPVVLGVQSRMLEILGHSLTIFESPTQALQHLCEHADAIDLLITDYRMPGLSGIQLVAQLRQAGVGFPAVILTAYPQEIDVETARRCNVQVVGKPIRMNDLVSLIGSI